MSEALARKILEESKIVAVLGAHWKESKAAFYVPQYLFEHGYTVIPVNPVYADRELWGRHPLESVDQIGEPVDVVDVFRRSESLMDHVPAILAMEHQPKYVWFQLGIRNDEAAAKLEAAGIEVVQDRCMLADHRAWLG